MFLLFISLSIIFGGVSKRRDTATLSDHHDDQEQRNARAPADNDQTDAQDCISLHS
jgi:hypothetical protein